MATLRYADATSSVRPAEDTLVPWDPGDHLLVPWGPAPSTLGTTPDGDGDDSNALIRWVLPLGHRDWDDCRFRIPGDGDVFLPVVKFPVG